MNEKDWGDELFSRKELKNRKKIVSSLDRSKFKKTDLEKYKKLREEEHLQKISKKELYQGIVLAISPEGITVSSDHKKYLCSLRGVLKKEKGKTKNLLTVGDIVLFEKNSDLTGSISHIEKRRSVLSREDHLRRRKEQLIAANIDLVLITVTPLKPTLKPTLVDRYIIATYKGNMTPVIVINKIDLLKGASENEIERYHEFIKTYQNLSITVCSVSAITGDGIEELKAIMKDKTSVFSGQSGVGKSSLINIAADFNLKTGEMVEKTQKGSHTTTTTSLLELPFGGFCIDTPGIRSFGLWNLSREDLDAYFPEIKELSLDCHFPNCTHSHEPECAVKQGIEEGSISLLRVESYQKLITDIEETKRLSFE